jgi:hypothetical protein
MSALDDLELQMMELDERLRPFELPNPDAMRVLVTERALALGPARRSSARIGSSRAPGPKESAHG